MKLFGNPITYSSIDSPLLTLFKSFFPCILLLLTCTPMQLSAAESYDAAVSSVVEKPHVIKVEEAYPSIAIEIITRLQQYHFLRRKMDNAASKDILDAYIDSLDPLHVYFYQSDIDNFSKYRYKLDNMLMDGDLDPIFDMYNLFQVRYINRLEYMLSLLDCGIEHYTFTSDEALNLEEKEAWSENTKEKNNLWERRLKANILSMQLNGKTNEEITQLLKKRYTNRLSLIKKTKSEDVFLRFMNVVAAIYDPHSEYFSPRGMEDFSITMKLSFHGIGAMLRSEDEYTVVVRLIREGPADKQGDLKASDRIIGVGQGKTGKIIDVVGWRVDDVVKLIRGPANSIVRLEVISSSDSMGDSRIISISRNVVKLEDQEAKEISLGVDKKIGIIDIPSFYADFEALQKGNKNFKSTTRDVKLLIDEYKKQGIEGLIIDLRNNGGGSLEEARSLVGLFIKTGPVVQIKETGDRLRVFADTDESTFWDGPLLVLVNRLSASASEIFAGAIQDYGRGIIVGSQTFGKGTVQTLLPLNHGQIKLTNAKFYRISGGSTQHTGIIPDIHFPNLYDHSQIGESALTQALPWDVIEPLQYQQLHELTKINTLIPNLNELHVQRANQDYGFKYLRLLSRLNQEQSEKTEISLNKKHRIQANDKLDVRRLELENTLRKFQGKAVLKSVQELRAQDEAEQEKAVEKKTGSKDKEDAENDDLSVEDIALKESIKILRDYIDLTSVKKDATEFGDSQ